MEFALQFVQRAAGKFEYDSEVRSGLTAGKDILRNFREFTL